ncbi:hypothetical protein H2200_009697 [Cladophialophora chaetospira]|uniref:Uncharacterized protein n=1 Tax=Cladophialophora chaetospira TaxID=386627 RepID=A0AA38X356_9EURO|nr:hypothetical protein H2200_009697 [Cladophialophora chaetospira]
MDPTYVVPLTIGSMSPEASKAKYRTALTLIAAGVPAKNALGMTIYGIINGDEATNPTLTERELLKTMAEFRARVKGKTRDLVFVSEPVAPLTVLLPNFAEKQEIMNLARFCVRSWGVRDEDIEYSRRFMVKTTKSESDDSDVEDESESDDKKDDPDGKSIDNDTDSDVIASESSEAGVGSREGEGEGEGDVEEDPPKPQTEGRRYVIKVTTTHRIPEGERICRNCSGNPRPSPIPGRMLLLALSLLLLSACIALVVAARAMLHFAAEVD